MPGSIEYLTLNESNAIKLLDYFTIITAVEETPDWLKQLWYKFKQIRLNNLSHEASQKLIRYLTQNLAVSDYEMLETRVITLSNGLPLDWLLSFLAAVADKWAGDRSGGKVQGLAPVPDHSLGVWR
jgi:hypothetical protein